MSAFMVFLGVFFLMGGVGVAYGGYQSRNKALRAYNWPTVRAELEEADYHRVSSNGTNPGSDYVYDLDFRYEYDGKAFEGTDFSPVAPERRSKEEQIQDDLREYSAGQTVNVRVNPAEPSESYLELPEPEEAKKHGTKGLIIGVILSIAAVGMIAGGLGIGTIWRFWLQIAGSVGIY